jgi:putative ABC transport system permease protein
LLRRCSPNTCCWCRDTAAGFAVVLAICVLASVVAIRMALRVDPAEAIGG